MASSYPGSFDSFPTITADKLMSDTVGGRAHRALHNDMGDVIEAMQAELGLNPSGQAATVVARLDNQTVVNVKDYGAAGNDSTDDTTAIQNALSAGAGKTVYVPPGTYKITDYLTVSANTVVTGPGTIHQTGTGKAGLTLNGSGITVEGITLKGRHATAGTYAAGEYAIYVQGGSTAARFTDTTIRNVHMHLWGTYGVYARWVTRFRILDCWINDIGYTGIGVLSGEEGAIRGNRIDNITPGVAGDMYGVALTSGGGSAAVDPRSARITVAQNVISRVNWEACDTHGGLDLTFTGNVLYDNYDNFALVGGPNNTVPTNITITGNTVFNTADTAPPIRNAGVRVTGDNAGVGTYCRGIVITGNTFRGVQYGVVPQATIGLVISGNAFHRCSPSGIGLEGWNKRFAITGNTFVDMWSDSANTACVEESYGYDSGLIAHNVLVRGDKSATYVNDFGVRVLGTQPSVAIQIGANDFTDAANAAPIYSDNMTDYKTGGWWDQDPIAKPTVTGSRGSNAALASLCTALANLGLITNSTS